MNLGGGPVFPELGFSLLVAPLDRVLRQRDLAARGALATRWKRAPLLATKMETSRKRVAVMATRRGKKRGFSLPSGMRPQPPLGVQAVSKVPSPQNHRWPVLIKVACTVPVQIAPRSSRPFAQSVSAPIPLRASQLASIPLTAQSLCGLPFASTLPIAERLRWRLFGPGILPPWLAAGLDNSLAERAVRGPSHRCSSAAMPTRGPVPGSVPSWPRDGVQPSLQAILRDALNHKMVNDVSYYPSLRQPVQPPNVLAPFFSSRPAG